MFRRALAALGLTVAVLALTAGTASAHALLARSEPAAGAALASSPAEVVLHFTEQPEASLSLVHVLDQSGKTVEQGHAAVDPTDAHTLRVGVPTLPTGTYTVTWRSTSAVDGHTTAGSFAFGVGQAPASGAVSSTVGDSSPAPSALSVFGRGLLYAGLALLVGGPALMLALRVRRIDRWAIVLTVGAWAAATAGALMVGLDEYRSSGASFQQFLHSSPGRRWIQLLVVLFIAAIAVGVLAVRPRRRVLVGIGMLALAAMWLRADSGHAAASTAVWFTVGTQWLHFAAVGVWLGALPWFVVLLWRTPADERAALAKRFSIVATLGILVVAATGTLRAIDEVSSWGQLVHDSFGRTLSVKLGIVAVIAAVGAVNHFVLTRRLPARSSALRRAVVVEIALGAVVVMVTGLLTGLAPASSVAAANTPAQSTAQLTVEGHDYATTTRVALEVTPGIVGPNRFSATVTDYDTHDPVDASAVKLRFALSSRPDLGKASLDLAPAGSGRWEASGATLAMPGVWQLTAVVSDASGGVEVPLLVTPTIAGQQTTTTPSPGQPTIYDMLTSDGFRLQSYVDPGRSGLNQLHITAFDSAGNEQPLDSVTMVAYAPDGSSTTLTPSRLDPGHFVAPVTLTPGTWTYVMTADSAGRTTTAMFQDPAAGQ
jgi:copper transport protein